MVMIMAMEKIPPTEVGNRRTAFYMAGPEDLGPNQSLPFR